MPDTSSPLHPRPQMARALWLDLRGEWEFAYDDRDVGIAERWQDRDEGFDLRINVPFPPESPASGIGDTGFHPVVWYRRTFDVEQQGRDTIHVLNFGAVDYAATVWVNGSLVATHTGGHTPFRAVITHALTRSGPQVLVVRASDPPDDLSQPRGKQDWQEKPHDIWYHRTTGIWQPVWIETLHATHITTLRWTPDVDRAVLDLEMTLSRPHPRHLRVRIRLTLHGREIVDDVVAVHGSEMSRDLAFDLSDTTITREDVLWAPDAPNLIDAIITLLDGDDVLDEVFSYAGLRTVAVGGGRFLLNGAPYYLRFALEQGYWPDTHLAAPSDEALRREVELARSLGFNGVRVHQKVEDPRFLYWCDVLGLLVWGEMANAYVYSPAGSERLAREWTDVLARDYSHPCIVAWVPINESWGVPNLVSDESQQHFLRALYHLTKALDATRPVIANDGWEYLVGDVFGVHDYTFQGQTIAERYGSPERLDRTVRDVRPGNRFLTVSDRQPGVPVMLTEFGGISFKPSSGENWFGYGTVEDGADYVNKYRELVDAVKACSEISGYCYTQLTDTAQETNGLLTENREPKFDPGVIRAINRAPSST